MNYIGNAKGWNFLGAKTHLWRILSQIRAQVVIFEIFWYVVRIR